MPSTRRQQEGGGADAETHVSYLDILFFSRTKLLKLLQCIVSDRLRYKSDNKSE